MIYEFIIYEFMLWSYSVVVITADFESADLSSNLGKTFNVTSI